MDLAGALQPLTIEDFHRRWFGQRPMALVREDARFAGLVTVEELEARINDGCASLVNLAIIGPDGSKLPPKALYESNTDGTWRPFFLRKARALELLRQNHGFVMHNLSEINPRVSGFARSLEQAVPGMHADLHVYVSLAGDSTGYRVHCDIPQHKIYLQARGTTHWRVYKGRSEHRAMPLEQADRELELDFEVTLRPGSVLYLPPGIYHHVTSRDGPRISLSFPFVANEAVPQVDRTHVPLTELFGSLG